MAWRSHPLLATLAALTVLLLALILFWDWNWLRPLVELRASAALGRSVSIGHFDLRLSGAPMVTVDDAAISNPPGFGGNDTLATVKRLQLRFDAWAALRGRIVIPSIEIDEPQGTLRAKSDGTTNWQFGKSGVGQPTGAEQDAAGPEIGRLTIRDGRIRFVDPRRKADFSTFINTDEPRDGSEPRIVVAARGTYDAQPIDAHFSGGSLLSLRNETKPYPVDLDAKNGATHIRLTGTLRNPLKFSGANLKLLLEGDNLAKLQPLIGVPLAPTPRYRLAGLLDYADRRIRFRNFDGRVGDSDLSGRFEVDPGKERPRIDAVLTSQRIVLDDLGGFIGATPGRTDAPNQSATQKEEHRQKQASPKLLPDTPLNVPDVKSADFHIHYEGKRIEGRSMPLDNLVADFTLENGKVTLTPLSFGVGKGEIASNIEFDARQNPAHAKFRVEFKQVDLHRLMQSTHIFEGAGTIGGRAYIDTSGNSLADMLGRGDGDLKLFMTGGDVSALLVDLAGIDLGNSILSALGIPQRTQIRCMVSDFSLNRGQLQTRTFFLDTTEANVTGNGKIDLQNERIDYRIATEPKHFSVGAVPAPIDIDGPLKSPSVGPDTAALAARAGPSVALGVLLTPLAALLPTIQLGLGKDNDCAGSIARIEAASKALPGVKTKKAAPPHGSGVKKGGKKTQ